MFQRISLQNQYKPKSAQLQSVADEIEIAQLKILFDGMNICDLYFEEEVRSIIPVQSCMIRLDNL